MDTVALATHRRTLIIDLAQALFGASYPLNHTWNVLTSKTREGRYVAHVIVYEYPGASLQSWKVLKSGGKSRIEASAGDYLLEELRAMLGERVAILEAGMGGGGGGVKAEWNV